MTPSADINWVSGPTGPLSRSEMRRARKSRNKKRAKIRKQERQQQQHQQQQHTTKEVAPPLRMDELPLVPNTVILPSHSDTRALTASPVAEPTADNCGTLEAATGDATAAAVAADLVATRGERPTVGEEQANRVGDESLREVSPADCKQVWRKPASVLPEDKQAVEESREGNGTRPTTTPQVDGEAKGAKKRDQPKASIYMDITAEEYGKAKADAAVWARRKESALKMGDKGPSWFESETFLHYGQPPFQHSSTEADSGLSNCIPILNRVEGFAMACGLSAGVAPLLLGIMVSRVFGEAFTTSVSVLSAHDVDYMFQVFWDSEISPFSAEEVFFWLASTYGNGAITKECLRPFIIGAVQAHYDYNVLAPDVRVQYIEAVVTTIFSRLSRCGVITLHDLCRSDFVAFLNAVGRLEIRLEDCVYFSPSSMLAMTQVAARPPCYQSGGCIAGFGGAFQLYHQSDVPNINAPEYVRSPW